MNGNGKKRNWLLCAWDKACDLFEAAKEIAFWALVVLVPIGTLFAIVAGMTYMVKAIMGW